EVQDMHGEMTGIKSDMQVMRSEIGGVKSEVQDMHGEMTVIKSDMQGMRDEITGIKGEIANMKSQLEENTQLIKAIHHRQEETDAKLEALSLDFAKLHGDVVSIKKTVNELNENQTSIHEVLGEHEVSIRSL